MRSCLSVRVARLAALSLIPAAIASAGWFKEIQLRTEPEVEDKRDFTVRLRPNLTHTCEVIEFESFYHQEFPWEDARGRKYRKVIEPVSHVHRRSDVKLVNDLDAYISFRVPSARAGLEAKYGLKTFNKDASITIAHVRITGYAEGKAIWTFDIPVDTKLDMQALDKQAEKRADPEEEKAPPERIDPAGSPPALRGPIPCTPPAHGSRC